jgi:hypothetical protein
VFPFDISLYVKNSDVKVQPNDGTAVEITCPIPAELLDGKDKLFVACVINGKLQVIPVKILVKNGVYCAVFTATHFSPYAFVIDKDGKLSNLAAGAGATNVTWPADENAANAMPYIFAVVLIAIGLHQTARILRKRSKVTIRRK